MGRVGSRSSTVLFLHPITSCIVEVDDILIPSLGGVGRAEQEVLIFHPHTWQKQWGQWEVRFHPCPTSTR